MTLNWTQRAVRALLFSVCFLFAGFSLKHIKQYVVESKVFQKYIDTTESDMQARCEGRSSVSEVLVAHVESLGKSQVSKIKFVDITASDAYEMFDLGFNGHFAKRIMRETKIKKIFLDKHFSYLSDFQYWSLSGLKDFFRLFHAIRLVIVDSYRLGEDTCVSLAVDSSIDRCLVTNLLISLYMLSFLCYEKGANLYMQLNTFFSFLSWNWMNICLVCFVLLWCSFYPVKILCKVESKISHLLMDGL